jgi:DNA-binding NarL/FixJ family response regulator
MKKSAQHYPIAVVDEHPVMRQGLTTVLDTWPNCKVVLQARNGAHYAELLPPEQAIHLALVALFEPQPQGFETIAWIRSNQPGTCVAALVFAPTPAVVHRAVQAGAHSVLCKTIGCDELVVAVEQLCTTGYHHSPLMQAHMLYQPDAGSPEALRARVIKDLTKRQQQFLLLYIDPANYTQVEIARRMKITPNTVDDFRKRIGDKLGVRKRVDIIHFARRFGLG